jgi:hypothetical protein
MNRVDRLVFQAATSQWTAVGERLWASDTVAF